MSKNLRTPIIKPRSQGGTFYTFGSAMEDIGLNINESSNKVELSHYVLLNIPNFKADSVFDVSIHSDPSDFDASLRGDYIFAEAFQDYVLNKETSIQNGDNYRFSDNETISERVFWSWVFKDSSLLTDFDSSNGYYIEKNPIVQAFGRISASSQRTDDYGIYNETFVQIPSSYGKMRVLFKNENNDNFKIGEQYFGHNEGYIESIDASTECTGDTLNATGISALMIGDDSSNGTPYYISDKALRVELDINKLQEFYNNDDTLTYDDLGQGKYLNEENEPVGYAFNAILVYYSIYTPDGEARLATNAYGLYILENSTLESLDSSSYAFKPITKTVSTPTTDGNGFSFRLNIKPTSAYSGDIKITDNSTTAFEGDPMFNEVLRSLTTATNVLNSNNLYIAKLVDDNKTLKNTIVQMSNKISSLEERVRVLENT